MAHLRPRYRYVKQLGKRSKKVLTGYAAEFYDPSRHPARKYVSLRTKDKSEAMQKLTQLGREYAMKLFDPWADAVPEDGLFFSTAIDRFLKSRQKADCRPKTIQVYRETLEVLRKGLPPGLLISQVETRHLDAFLTRLGLSDTSRNTYARQLRTFFTWCAAEGYLKQNPAKQMKAPRAPRKVVSYLTRAEYEQLVRAIEADVVVQGNYVLPGQVLWLIDVVRFAVGTGLRLREICHLRWSAVNLAEGTLTVKASGDFQPKSGHERVVYVAGEALEVLQRFSRERTREGDDFVFKGANGDKLAPDYVSKRFRHFRRLARLPENIHFHSLRHTYASWLVMAGVDLYRVKELMGHASIQTTMRYAHLAPDTLKSVVERVFGSGVSVSL